MGFIRTGREDGWLQLAPQALIPWALLNDVRFSHIVPGQVPGRGAALLAKEHLSATSPDEGLLELLTVPQDLILSLERVQEHAKVDQDMRELLEGLGDFGRTARGAMLTFLLVQASISCPHLAKRVGVHCAFTDYVKSLPAELLPSFWTEDERALLVGTTLAPAVSQKLRSLDREYRSLHEAGRTSRWLDVVDEHLDFDDWLQVDAMYRSRALDFPEIGHCMVPCIDLANHQPGQGTTAIYEKDKDGNASLQLRPDRQLREGEEVTITYGDEKGACEMLFSYGFLEDDRESAETLFLSLSIPDSDPYAAVKAESAGCAPGFRLIDRGGDGIDWTGDYIWVLCVTADDGLRFELARTIDGNEEVQAFFGDGELTGGAAQLHSLLAQTELWAVYRLRAVAILQQRIFDQLQALYGTQEAVEALPHGDGLGIRDRVYGQALRLRQLEFDLLERAYEDFERQKIELASDDVVKRYLSAVNEDEPQHPEEDFA